MIGNILTLQTEYFIVYLICKMLICQYTYRQEVAAPNFQNQHSDPVAPLISVLKTPSTGVKKQLMKKTPWTISRPLSHLSDLDRTLIVKPVKNVANDITPYPPSRS